MESIFQKSFDNITSVDIQNLIDIKYKERQRVEYKREMYKHTEPLPIVWTENALL